MMALLLSFVLLTQNTPPDTTTTKPDPDTKTETTAKGTTPTQPKIPAHITLLLNNPDPASVRTRMDEYKQLVPAYEQYMQLQLNDSDDAVKKLITPDFVLLVRKEDEPLRGKQAVKQLQKQLQETVSGFGSTAAGNVQITIKKLFIKKDKAVTYVEEKTSWKESKTVTRSESHVTEVAVTCIYKHTWRKTKAGWKLRSVENGY